MSTKVFCLILNYNHFLDTEKCVRALQGADLPSNSQILILDNSPGNESVNYLKSKFPKIKIIKNRRNLGFAGGNNVGIKFALAQKTTHILIINPDVIIGKNFFKPLLADLNQNPQLGLIAPAIRHFQGSRQLYGLEGILDRRLVRATHINLKKLPLSALIRFGDFVTFACVLIKSEVFNKVGPIDQRYFMYLEDVDYCLMAGQKGYQAAVDSKVVVDHQTSSSFDRPTDKLKISFISQLKFIDKWQKFPQSLRSYLYALAFYPYLYLLWTAQRLRRQLP